MKKSKLDLILLFAVIMISLFGVMMIYSSSSIWAEYKFNNPYKYLITQSVFLVVGTILMIIISKISYTYYLDKANTLLFGCFVLVILELIPGIGTIRNGSRSWFGIGGFGIQPSEFMKLAMIVFVSKYLYKNNKDIKNI